MILFRLEKKTGFHLVIYDRTQTHVQSCSVSYISESDFGVRKSS
jgi:hypothetical protein